MSTLDAARWKAVSPYLQQALDLAPEERTAFLATVRAQSPEVAADLAASERALLAQARGDLSAALSLMTRALTPPRSST